MTDLPSTSSNTLAAADRENPVWEIEERYGRDLWGERYGMVALESERFSTPAGGVENLTENVNDLSNPISERYKKDLYAERFKLSKSDSRPLTPAQKLRKSRGK